MIRTGHHYNFLLFIIISPVIECARDAEEWKDNAKKEFGQRNVATGRLGRHLDISISKRKKCNAPLIASHTKWWKKKLYQLRLAIDTVCHFLSKNVAEFRLHRWQPECEQESDSQMQKFFGPGFKNFGTGAKSESENVTTATSVFQKGPQFKTA